MVHTTTAYFGIIVSDNVALGKLPPLISPLFPSIPTPYVGFRSSDRSFRDLCPRQYVFQENLALNKSNNNDSKKYCILSAGTVHRNHVHALSQSCMHKQSFHDPARSFIPNVGGRIQFNKFIDECYAS